MPAHDPDRPKWPGDDADAPAGRGRRGCAGVLLVAAAVLAGLFVAIAAVVYTFGTTAGDGPTPF